VAAERVEAATFIQGLLGRRLTTVSGFRNEALRLDNGDVIVATQRSREGQPVPLASIQSALDRLVDDGVVEIDVDSVGYRSAFIGAALRELPGARVEESPPRVLWSAPSDLHSLFARAVAALSTTRSGSYDGADPFARLFVSELREAVAAIVADEVSYLVEGSAGKGNWAETPWVSVFDRMVTETARRGYYIVYLFPSDGSGVFLSLNQGTTVVHEEFGARDRDVLAARAAAYATDLGSDALAAFSTGPIDLRGHTSLTRRYEVANIAAQYYAADALPASDVLGEHLRAFLDLYGELVAAKAGVAAETSPDAPDEAITGTEAKRYRWHRQAEGRNRRIVRDAKKLQGYRCQVCNVDFQERLGPLGERCIDAHHLVPFADLDERPRELDPSKDFAIVCSNCHRMLHSETPPLGVAELQQRLGHT
jgi:5-methylcytosine-specific restriction enzyme A